MPWTFLDKYGAIKQAVATPLIAKAITNGTNAASNLLVPFTSAEYDTDSMWASGDPTKLTCKHAGIYRFAGQASLGATSAVSNIDMMLKKNGTTIFGEWYTAASPTAGQVVLNVVGAIVLAVGDYVQLLIQSGLTRSLTPSGAYSAYLETEKIG
jgi:hypothetical protein